ncbi:MAG: peptidase, partial [Bacteroidetes bacterium]|nr:peptidase [Bacteroidota bacterium]
MRTVELLSPAKNLECGLAAINHGADAVYIGAPMFSARAAAGNTIADIEQLISYAHRYRCKVLVALNTVLTDSQLTEAEKLIHQLYEIGTDALIVQDMGILQLDLPPIELHASTQTDNRTVEKVRFLQDVGFSRVILARELTLNQIREIHKQTEVELECFVHGSLCVSYSGQCYISEAMTGRSANRGECSQYCRITAFYRKKMDAILEGREDVRKSSSGTTTFFFEPNPDKSFRRSATDYFLNGRHKDISQPETPKSIGEEIGTVTYISAQF